MAQTKIRTKPIDALIVHHTVTPQMWSQEQTMKNLNASKEAYDGKAPYHRIIGHDWDTVGRPDNTVGHQSGSSTVTNDQSMGIALVGNFNEDTITPYQEKRLGEILRELSKQYSVKPERVFLHREVRDEPTACPGNKTTKSFITNLLQKPMPEKTLHDFIVDGMPADERITALKTQVGTLQGEVRKRDDMINSPTEGIQALKNTVADRDKLLDQKRTQITDLQTALDNCGASPEDQAKVSKFDQIKGIANS